MKRKAFLFIKRVLLLLIVVFLIAPLNTIEVEAAGDNNPEFSFNWGRSDFFVNDTTSDEQTGSTSFDKDFEPHFVYRPTKDLNETKKFHQDSSNGYLNRDPVFSKNHIELQYLESDSGQYIDTGYAPNQNTRLEYIFMPLETGKKYVGEKETDKNFSISDNSGLYFSFGDSTIPGSNPATISANTKYYLNVGNPNFNVYQYEHEYSSNYNEPAIHSSSATTSDFQSAKNIYLFGIEGEYSKQKVYGAKIYEGSALKKDFIPVMTLNIIPASDNIDGTTQIAPGTPCMYDKNEEKYYVSGSGDFLAGPALVTFNGVQYGVVDYIETQVGSKTGADGPIDVYPFINTDARFDGSQNFKISAKVTMENVNADNVQYLFCLGKQSGSTVYYDGICLYYDNLQKKIVAQYSYKDFDGNEKNIASKELFDFGDIAEFDIENNSGIITMYKDGTSPSDDVINGEATAIDSTKYKVIADNYLLHFDAKIGNSLFKGNLVDSAGDSDYPTKGSIYYFQTYNTINGGHKDRLWANGAGSENNPSTLYLNNPNNYKAQDGEYDIQRDFIPVKVMSTGEYGLLDLVAKKFYGNEQSPTGCTTPSGFISNDHAPTGEAALYTIVDNNFHSYEWETADAGTYETGVKLGNVGKALYASWIHNKSKNYQNAIKDLTMNWKVNKDDILSDIVAPKGAEKIPGYSGFYALAGDVDEGIKQLDEVKTETYGYYLFENGKELVDITYTLGNANGGQSLTDFNTANSETFKNAGDYTINFEITPKSFGGNKDMNRFLNKATGSYTLHIVDVLPDPIIPPAPTPGHYSIPDTGIKPFGLFPLNPFLN